MTGYEQVRSIAAELAGDHVARERVELIMAETGVCGGGGLRHWRCCLCPHRRPRRADGMPVTTGIAASPAVSACVGSLGAT
jgi:hypothetical protein